MLYSREWLSQYVELPATAAELGDLTTSIGFAVEGIEKVGDDDVLDLEINPNRPDCMNHLGLAREIAAASAAELQRPEIDATPEVHGDESSDVRIEIDDPVGCPRYAAVVVRGIRVGASPEWLQRRLEAVGVRPINNIVDITNYVLWEYGQPLHAFDLDKLSSPKVVVRRAARDEILTTLDGEERALDSEVLVIADESGAVALAGIMGGASTEVTASTTSVLIESAHFAPSVVRKGARKLAMHTDASHRFERGSDSEICLEAALRAAQLMADLAAGELPEVVVDCRKEDPWSAGGTLGLDSLDAFAGTPIPGDLIERVFPTLGFDLGLTGERTYSVQVPSWRRFDIELDPDGVVYPAHLYEEAIRFFGYENVPATLPPVGGPDEGSSATHQLRETLRRALSSVGLAETITYGFYDPQADALFPGLAKSDSPLRLANPLSEQYSVMRRSLLPNLVEGARFNQNRGQQAVRLFEIGHLFPGGSADEIEAVGLVVGGSAGTPWSRSVDLDFFDLKGVVEMLAEDSGVRLEYRAAELPGLISCTACEVFVEGSGADPGTGTGAACGYLGQVAGSDFTFQIFAAEIDTRIFETNASPRVEAPSRFPGVSVDLTLTHALDIEWTAIAKAIEEARPNDLRHFGLKDRYTGKGVPQGAVNTTIYFDYKSASGSLTQDEVNDRHERLARHLREQFGQEV